MTMTMTRAYDEIISAGTISISISFPCRISFNECLPPYFFEVSAGGIKWTVSRLSPAIKRALLGPHSHHH